MFEMLGLYEFSRNMHHPLAQNGKFQRDFPCFNWFELALWHSLINNRSYTLHLYNIIHLRNS